MKLTWFGGTTIRIYIGGTIIVVDAAGAPVGIDQAELVSGADQVLAVDGLALSDIDGATWRPRRPERLIDGDGELAKPDIWTIGEGVIVVDAPGEAPLLLLAGDVPTLGRWVEGAVVTVFGSAEQIVHRSAALLDMRAPRLLVLAGDESAVDDAIPVLRDKLDGAGLAALEAGLALEV